MTLSERFKNFTRIRFILPAFLILIVLLFIVNIKFGFAPFISTRILSLLETTGLVEKSTANLYIDGNNLKAEFNISEKDKEKLTLFNSKLGIDDRWIEGVSLELDGTSLATIDQNLPLKVYLDFSETGLSFSSDLISKSGGLPGLNSALPIKEYKMSTHSANLTFKQSNERDFEVKIEKLDGILNDATTSGKINISQELTPLFPMASKIAKITLKVKGKSVRGNLVLN